MRKTDINKFVGAPSGNAEWERAQKKMTTASAAGNMIWKAILTIGVILAVAGTVVLISMISFIMSMKDESIKMDLNDLKLNYTSFVYVNDENNNPVEYMRLYSSENRVWVNYEQIPENMKNAMIAIEDKRFEEHDGVDWIRTFGAVTNLFTKGGSYGGSTITQQLIKNLTGDNDVSLTRKVKEIFRALNLEKQYTKDQILEAYLNVVNFGSGCHGVQAAANLYFNKDISECSLAECAAIAGITQNPYQYTPLIFPEENKKRREIVLDEMYNQGKITKEEYDQAMQESATMVFSTGETEEEEEEENTEKDDSVWNWYIETMVQDLVKELQTEMGISAEKAEDMLYHGGLKIYCAMDQNAQQIAESVVTDADIMPSDQAIELGYFMMDYSGRVLATIGQRGEKTGNLWMSYATDSVRQPGSTIKPLSVYGPAINMGVVNYSSLIPDEPLDNYFGPGEPGPYNWDGKYRGDITVEYALEQSLNAPAVQLCNMLSPSTAYQFLTESLNFTHLNPDEDANLSAMSLGGMDGGVTVAEMTAGYQIFGNGGQYNEPYTYFYVEDHDGNVILDHRTPEPKQAITSASATIMNQMLRDFVRGSLGYGAGISGWEVFGKTGTSDEDKDSWFVGGTPYAVAGIWTGYEQPSRLYNTSAAKRIWQNIMAQYLEDKESLSFTYDTSVVSATYCEQSGKLAGPNCKKTRTGWYESGKLPGTCDGIHKDDSSTVSSSLEISSLPSSSSPSSSESSSTPSSSSESSSSSQQSSSTPSSSPPSSNESSSSESSSNDSGDDGNSHTNPSP